VRMIPRISAFAVASALWLLAAAPLSAGDLRVVVPGRTLDVVYLLPLTGAGSTIVSSDSRSVDSRPKTTFRFTRLKKGDYLVCFQSIGNPVGFVDTLAAKRVSVARHESAVVHLKPPTECCLDGLPKETKEFLDSHKHNLLELTATFDGCRTSFEQVRLCADFIHYLRQDCQHTLKVWNHRYDEFPEKSEVIYERTFRATKSTH
jgi:hypothetical protein